jgi:hypothetical protein
MNETVEVQLHVFLIAEVHKSEWSAAYPYLFTPGKQGVRVYVAEMAKRTNEPVA